MRPVKKIWHTKQADLILMCFSIVFHGPIHYNLMLTYLPQLPTLGGSHIPSYQITHPPKTNTENTFQSRQVWSYNKHTTIAGMYTCTCAYNIPPYFTNFRHYTSLFERGHTLQVARWNALIHMPNIQDKLIHYHKITSDSKYSVPFEM